MDDLLEDFKSYFLNQGLVTDSQCTLDYLPSTDKAKGLAVAIYEYQGQNPMAQIDGSHRSIQIVTRAEKVRDARTKSVELYNSLVTEDHRINLTSKRWGMLYLRQPPFRFKVDESGRVLYAFNLGITTYTD